jgi:hypothetical protein
MPIDVQIPVSELFKRYDIYHVDLGGNWIKTLVGSGVLNYNPLFVQPYTGTTANSSVLAYARLGSYFPFSLANKLWEFIVHFYYSQPSTGYIRVQIKNNTNLGTLASGDYGIEFELQSTNGNGRCANGGTPISVSLGTVSSGVIHELKIVKRSNSALDFYVDDVLLGSLLSSLPTSNLLYLVLSIENGASASGGHIIINKMEFRVKRI